MRLRARSQRPAWQTSIAGGGQCALVLFVGVSWGRGSAERQGGASLMRLRAGHTGHATSRAPPLSSPGRVLLPFVHVLVPQQSGASKVRKDTRYKISKLKQLIKTLAPPASSLPAAQLRGGGRGGGGGGTSRQAPLADKGGLDGGSTGLGVTAMAAGADLALLSPHPFQPQPQELSKLSAVVLELSAGVEAVSAARSRDTAALADVSVKVDALGGELSAVRELLAAVLQGMQQQQHMQLQYMQQQQQQQWRAVDASGSGGGDQQPMQPMQPLEAQQPPQPQPESPLSALGAGWDQAAAAAATIFGTGARRRSSGSGARGTPPRGTPRTSG